MVSFMVCKLYLSNRNLLTAFNILSTVPSPEAFKQTHEIKHLGIHISSWYNSCTVINNCNAVADSNSVFFFFLLMDSRVSWRGSASSSWLAALGLRL